MTERLPVRECQTLTGHCWMRPYNPEFSNNSVQEVCRHCGATRAKVWVITEGPAFATGASSLDK